VNNAWSPVLAAPEAGEAAAADEATEDDDTRTNLALGLGIAGLVAGLIALGLGLRGRRVS